jgi:hypothetical protein
MIHITIHKLLDFYDHKKNIKTVLLTLLPALVIFFWIHRYEFFFLNKFRTFSNKCIKWEKRSRMHFKENSKIYFSIIIIIFVFELFLKENSEKMSKK